MADINGHRKTTEIARTLSTETSAMTLLSNRTLYKSNEMLRNSAEDLRILSTTEMRGRQLRPLITLDIQAASCFPLWNETETKANTTRANQAKANQAKRCRTQSGHLDFDIYIAKTQTPTVWLRNLPSWFCERVCIHDVIRWCFSLLDLQHTHDDLEETKRN